MSSMKLEVNKANKGFLIALASAVVLSFTGIIIKLVSEDYQLPALILAFWRDFFVVICAFPFLLLLKPQLLKVQKNNIGFLLIYGIALACFNIAWTMAVTLSGASVATVLVYSSAGFTALLGHYILKETLGVKKSDIGRPLLAGLCSCLRCNQPGSMAAEHPGHSKRNFFGSALCDLQLNGSQCYPARS